MPAVACQLPVPAGAGGPLPGPELLVASRPPGVGGEVVGVRDNGSTPADGLRAPSPGGSWNIGSDL